MLLHSTLEINRQPCVSSGVLICRNKRYSLFIHGSGLPRWLASTEQQQESLLDYVLTHSSGRVNTQKMPTKTVLFPSTVTLSSRECELHRGPYYSALARLNYFINLHGRIALNSI